MFEMYGFPLTIYLLARFTGLDREYISANLWSTLLGVGASICGNTAIAVFSSPILNSTDSRKQSRISWELRAHERLAVT